MIQPTSVSFDNKILSIWYGGSDCVEYYLDGDVWRKMPGMKAATPVDLSIIMSALNKRSGQIYNELKAKAIDNQIRQNRIVKPVLIHSNKGSLINKGGCLVIIIAMVLIMGGVGQLLF